MGSVEAESEPFRFAVLGAVRVWRGDAEIDPGSPQQCAVLSMLLSRRGRFISLDDILNGLWDNQVPAAARPTARTYISRLRRALSAGSGGMTIVTGLGGYALELTNCSVDFLEFEVLVESSRSSRASGDLTGAAEQLQRGLALWFGSALAGVPGDAVERERARLERLRVAASQELLELKLELGRHVEVVVELPALIAGNELNERLRELRMLALYRCGRQAEALEEYRKVRTLLRQELGIEPGPRLRELHEKLLRADPGLNLKPSAMRSRRPEQHPTLGARLQAQRHRLFVGREQQRRLFAAALAGSPDACSVLFINGAPGMGKSILLRRFADDAQQAGRAVVRVDARAVGSSRIEFMAAAGSALRVPDPVLLVDGFEEIQALETWFREEFLLALPGRAVVVLASTNSPSLAWRTDSAWAGNLRRETLRELSQDDARAMLELRGVPVEKWDSVLDFAGGHPLALSLAAEAALDGDSRDGPTRTVTRDVMDALLPQLVGAVPSGTHRLALQVCAHSYLTTEHLLDAVLPEGNAAELFGWLRRQPYVESSERGIYVHDLVREALEFDMRWRDPIGYEVMHRRIRHYVLGTLVSHQADQATTLTTMRAVRHLRRGGGVVPRYITASGGSDVEASGLRLEDHDALITMAGEVHGEDSAGALKFWLTRRPEAFVVYRDEQSGKPVAFLSWLRLDRADEVELQADPVIAEIWRHMGEGRPLGPGEHIAVARHIVSPRCGDKPSPIGDSFQLRLLAEWMHDANLAASYLVLTRPDFWRPLMDYLDQREVPCVSTMDGTTPAIFTHDWRAQPPEQWRDRHIFKELWGTGSARLAI
ncbi:MAG TPA: BTAD domain-containing putative transcriptional regulator [Pseudonocardia sp.]|uniref:BTAD domain-containing putative transcriptional regulator n=1 Tax=Pseudonocardia sp. TaxID=60912 RepID=UPI002B87E852|nr:BTAD domain-containing putative transcriptional regulator [Pseudonocardia sp.]HTF49412.1 BTAD domain-containing putative transcriptional regulator [Pseudonocardia sp.]